MEIKVFFYFYTAYSACTLAHKSSSIIKNPECLLPEVSGYCTPAIMYAAVPIEHPEVTSTCIAYPYYGEGGSRGFDNLTDCLYACGGIPSTTPAGDA